MIAKTKSAGDFQMAVDELLALPSAGKTAGPDHRVALYTMLGSVTVSSSVSQKVVQSAASLLSKETHDGAIKILAAALGPHLLQCLKDGVVISKDTVTLIVKEMVSTKPPVRRAFCSLVGDALWQLGAFSSEASVSFAQSVFPSFETNLKNIAANPLGAPAGPLEGYIAVAILLGPYAGSDRFSELPSRQIYTRKLISFPLKAVLFLRMQCFRRC